MGRNNIVRNKIEAGRGPTQKTFAFIVGPSASASSIRVALYHPNRVWCEETLQEHRSLAAPFWVQDEPLTALEVLVENHPNVSFGSFSRHVHEPIHHQVGCIEQLTGVGVGSLHAVIGDVRSSLVVMNAVMAHFDELQSILQELLDRLVRDFIGIEHVECDLRRRVEERVLSVVILVDIPLCGFIPNSWNEHVSKHFSTFYKELRKRLFTLCILYNFISVMSMSRNI